MRRRDVRARRCARHLRDATRRECRADKQQTGYRRVSCRGPFRPRARCGAGSSPVRSRSSRELLVLADGSALVRRQITKGQAVLERVHAYVPAYRTARSARGFGGSAACPDRPKCYLPTAFPRPDRRHLMPLQRPGCVEIAQSPLAGAKGGKCDRS
jgi:hypothetical protein